MQIEQSELSRVRYERALNVHRSQKAEQIVRENYISRWPDRHLVGLDGKPVPFHIAQDIGYDSESNIIALVAGTQSGKTSWGSWWLTQEIDRTASDEGENDYIVITSSYPLFRLKLLPSFLHVFDTILQRGRYWAGDKVFELKNPKTGKFEAKLSSDRMWGRVMLLSANSLGSLESATAKAAWLDEAGQDEFTLKAYQAILRRLSLHRGRQLFTTTLYNLGWVKSQIIDVAKQGGKEHHYKIGDADLIHTQNNDADICLVQYDSILNPEFSIDEFKAAQGRMDDAEFKMFYKGIAAKLKSIVYDVFEPSTHVIPSFKIPDGWPKGIIGIDPIGQKTAAVWLAFDPLKSELHLYREYEGDFGITTQGHVNEIVKLSRQDGMIVKAVGGGPSENQARIDWSAAGLILDAPPITDMWAQIGRVYALLKENSLYVHDCCPRIISDFGSMKRKQDRHGTYTDKIENKDIWHLLDALRYIVSWLMVGGDSFEVIQDHVSI